MKRCSNSYVEATNFPLSKMKNNMTFTAKLGIYYGDDRYIFPHIPAEKAAPFSESKHRRVIATLNNEVSLHVALMHDGKGDFFININKAVRKQLGVGEGDSIEISLKEDTSKYGMEVPEELEELLLQDPETEAYFDELTPGRQRRLIYLVAQPKTSDTRLKKAIQIADYLRVKQGKIDLQELNEVMKGR